MRRIITIILIIAMLLLFGGCVTTIHDYKPKSEDEAVIKSLLVEMETKFKNLDKPGYLSLWSDDAKIRVGKERKEMAITEFGKQLSPEGMKDVGPFKFSAPKKIIIKGNKAEVEIPTRFKNTTISQTFYFSKESGKWLFTGNDY